MVSNGPQFTRLHSGFDQFCDTNAPNLYTLWHPQELGIEIIRFCPAIGHNDAQTWLPIVIIRHWALVGRNWQVGQRFFCKIYMVIGHQIYPLLLSLSNRPRIYRQYLACLQKDKNYVRYEYQSGIAMEFSNRRALVAKLQNQK